MSADDFFSRWSKRKREAGEDGMPAADAAAPAAPAAPVEDLPPPTLEEVAALNHDADFRRFVAPGVDETVRRSAMKKLFTDPHFNVMDGLDIYIDDYNKFEPLPPAMLAMLAHAKPLLDPLGHLKQPAMRMLDLAPEQAVAPDAQAPAPALASANEGEAAPREAPVPPEPAAPAHAVEAPDPAQPGDMTAAQAPSEPTPQNSEAPEDEHPI